MSTASMIGTSVKANKLGCNKTTTWHALLPNRQSEPFKYGAKLVDAPNSEPYSSFTMEAGRSANDRASGAPRNNLFDTQNLQNRIHLFSCAISLAGPFLNFFYHWQMTLLLGMTQALMVWVIFGITWCVAFSKIMGPVFKQVAIMFSYLNFIPSLGSSLWAVFSVVIMVSVIKDGQSLPALHNLPLFSLILANFLTAANTVDDGRHSDLVSRMASGTDALLASFSFTRGRAASSILDSMFFTLFGRFASLPEQYIHQFYDLQKRCRTHYHKGQHSYLYERDFRAWQKSIPYFKKVFLMRRLLCSLGFIIELGALFFSCMALKRLFVSKDEAVYTFIQLSKAQVCAVLCSSIFSSYLWSLTYIDSTFSTEAEYRAYTLIRLESKWINKAGEKNLYLEKGHAVRFTYGADKRFFLPYIDAGTIGLVPDLEETSCNSINTKILKSMVVDVKISVHRGEKHVLKAEIYERESCEEDGGEETESNIPWELSFLI